MKFIFVFMFFIVFGLNSCMNFSPTYDKLSAIEQKNYTPQEFDTINSKMFAQAADTNIIIFRLDINRLKSLINQSEKKYFLLVSYTFWCPSSKSVFDSILNSKFTNTQLVLFTPDDWYYLPNYKRFLNKKQVYFPTYILDIYQYGFGYNPHKRFDKFKNKISNKLEDIGGFPSYILIDRNFNLVYKKSGGNFIDLLTELTKLTKN